MIWIFHGYIQIDISVLNTPSVYWSQDISLSIYDDDFMFVIIYPKDSLLQEQETYSVYMKRPKNTSITSPHTERKQEKLISLDFILVAWKTEQGFTWGYLL